MLPSLPHTFHNLYVLVQWYVCEFIRGSAGPTNLNEVDFSRRAHAQYFAWIVRRKITATAGA
jgi:hypothetical protein